jgi:uncharacterized protein YfaS (alpha-2-macroglobulin family)
MAVACHELAIATARDSRACSSLVRLLRATGVPRFVTAGDQFTAGAVINRRDGASVDVKGRRRTSHRVQRCAETAEQTTTLAAQRGSEVRFPFPRGTDRQRRFRFDVTERTNADAVRVTIPCVRTITR